MLGVLFYGARPFGLALVAIPALALGLLGHFPLACVVLLASLAAASLLARLGGYWSFFAEAQARYGEADELG
jgi:hypothetical protein